MAKQVELPLEYTIPSNWKWVKMGELTKVKSGFPFDSKLFSSNADVGRPLIRIRDIVKGTTETYTSEMCPDEYKVYNGDILIGMDGDFNVAVWLGSEALLNQRVCTIESVNEELLINKFLYYYLPAPLKEINDNTPSVTVKHLSTKTLHLTPVPLPPIAEQQRIVNRIESLFAKLDEVKEKLEAVVDSYETRKLALLNKAFNGDLTRKWRKEKGLHRKDWIYTSLSECGSWHGGGTPSTSHPEYWSNGNILWITSKDMKSDVINDTVILTNMVGVENSSAIYNDMPSIVFVTRSGILRRTLPIAMVYKPFTVNQDLKVLTPTNIDLEYLFLACKWQEKNILSNCMKNGTTVESINYNALLNFKLPIASKEEQKQIVKTVRIHIETESNVLNNALSIISKIDLLKKSILARAFRGELGTNDPEEESSIELLKQILEEK